MHTYIVPKKETKLAVLKGKEFTYTGFFFSCFPGELLELLPEVSKLAAYALFHESLFLCTKCKREKHTDLKRRSKYCYNSIEDI